MNISQDSQNQFTDLTKLSNDEEQCVNIKQETTDNIIDVDPNIDPADSKENQGVHIFKPALDLVDVKIEEKEQFEKEQFEKEDDENKPIKVKKPRKKSKKTSSLHNGAF